MASRTLNVASLYADGTTLNAYAFGPYVDNPDGTAPPTAAATAVSASGTVTFTGLTDGTRYYAGTGTGGYQYFGFSTPPAATAGAASGTLAYKDGAWPTRPSGTGPVLWIGPGNPPGALAGDLRINTTP